METPTTMTRRAAAALILALAIAGCDPLGDADTVGAPLATLHGTVTRAADAPAVDEIRLALVWYPGLLALGDWIDQSGDTVIYQFATGVVTQSVVYRASFPIEFEFDITTPPPIEAQVEIDEAPGPFVVAYGVLLAYQDRDGDSELTPCADTTSGCPDQVLAASGDPVRLLDGNEQRLVLYVDREVTDGGLTATPGINLMGGSYPAHPLEVLPHSTPLDLELTSDVHVQQLACEVITQRSRDLSPAVMDPAVAPPVAPPEGATLECTADGYSWELESCAGCQCDHDIYVYDLEGDAPTPDGWPCPRGSPASVPRAGC